MLHIPGLTLPFKLVQLLQFAFLLPVDILHFFGFSQLEARSGSRVHHLYKIDTESKRNENQPGVLNRNRLARLTNPTRT